MNPALPIGIYLENEKKFEFDFAKHLLSIKTFTEGRIAGTTVSPFRLIKTDDGMQLLIHNYDRTGDRKMMIESMADGELIINDDNTSYKLRKVA
ncbi:hypothetical protein [Mucilaginibacter myungsuensis]|uniref:Uncharacterized protein n=1 Tax=Mucilaginibacter myungsuensis TaxID=649104 RepID=A0A929PYK8_9SPHI|nr:hypothetical protein [Mucilaginibacter myungsuensis]MBE9664386.1 hypothetical protein [Mucilaginibacter myungsuensis]MDN3597097.1 hypothetical protein [Mucilaginibacter myungsuensis]